MLDIKTYRLLTPQINTLNINNSLTLYYRNEEVINYVKGDNNYIDLEEVFAAKTLEFNLVFYNLDNEEIKKLKMSEDVLQALYIFFSSETNKEYVEVKELKTSEFEEVLKEAGYIK